MKQDVDVKLQAYLDGELSGREARRVAARIAADPDSQGLFEELRFTRNALRQAEPEHPLPCDFDFYWSQIQRRIATAEPEPEPSLWEIILAWRRYLAPAAGLALLAFLAIGVARFSGPATDPFQHLAEIVNLNEQVGSYAFRSQSENMFVVWVYDKAQPAVGETEFTEEDMFLQ